MQVHLRCSGFSGSSLPEDSFRNLLCFRSPRYSFFFLIVPLGPFLVLGVLLLGTNLSFNIFSVTEMISLGKKICSRETVLGLVVCRWSMREEVGKSNEVRRVFKCLVGISTHSQAASLHSNLFIKSLSETMVCGGGFIHVKIISKFKADI